MSNDTALAVVSEQPQPQDISTNWTQDDLKALQETVAKGCNASQFKVFIAACRRLQLDPFARQITPIVQNGGMTPQVTIDGFRLIAERTRKYLGQVGPFWCGDDGEWHDKWLLDKPPTACKVGVIREGFREIMWGTARTKAYAKGNLWVTMPDVMIAKVAESLALRKAFPNELSGVYTREEMQQALAEDRDDDTPAVQPAPRTVTPEPIAPVTPRQERQPSAESGGPDKPATPQQIKVITQMGQLLGRGLPAGLTFQTAGKTIAEWQIEVRKLKQPRAVGAAPVEDDETLTYPTEGEPVPFDLRKANTDARVG